MRYLALDLGEARTGLAISDELGLTARPLQTVPASDLIATVRAVIDQFGTVVVVVGRPRHLGGELGAQAAAVDRAVSALKAAVPVTVIYEDESATTLESGGSDADAAAVILQGFLNERATTLQRGEG